MFQRLFCSEAGRHRHRDAPFAVERERYLEHCADLGATYVTLCAKTDRQLSDLRPTDIDCYFSEGAQRWCRVSASGMAAALRDFVRYAAIQGACDPRLAETIRGPRIYEQESLPLAPSWSDVQKVLADTLTDVGRDVRDRAILMLLAIYGMRSGEVASLRLDQLDWRHRIIRLFRQKRRQAQTYPLVPSVAEALARYIDTVRPRTMHQQVFIGLRSPQRPLTPSAIYGVVSKRFVVLGIPVGPHALRHACAARLVADGLTLKEIDDHLGHRSTSATRITPRSIWLLFAKSAISIWGIYNEAHRRDQRLCHVAAISGQMLQVHKPSPATVRPRHG